MQTIKFRAWGVDGESPVKMWSWEHIREDFDIWLDDKKAVIMQYTGLKDKNGKEVFEGDIVKTVDGNMLVVFVSAFCGFLLKKNGFAFDYSFYDYPDIEVIGNIHENPELLKESEEE